MRWLGPSQPVTWEPAAALADTAALTAWIVRPRGEFTVILCGVRPRLVTLLALPNLPRSRFTNLTSLLDSMDPNGVIPLKPTYPNTIGGAVGGRTVYRYTCGKGNVFLTCHEHIRAFVFGPCHDEVDISRSHISSVLGCWNLTGSPHTRTYTRMTSDQAQLESDIQFELTQSRASCCAELDDKRASAGGVPTLAQLKYIAYAQSSLYKCYMQPKQVFSAIINCRDPLSWRLPFPSSTCPTLIRCLDDALLMRGSVAQHPLCA